VHRPLGRLLFGEALAACAALEPDVAFDLVYLDPPYGVGTTMTARRSRGEARGRKQPASGPDAYVDDADVDALVAGLALVAAAVRERMRPHASFAIHLDHRAVHEAKVALDRVFGRGAFLGEIAWSPGNGARGRGFSTTHQTILLFARGPRERRDALWNAAHPLLREPYADTSLAMHFKHLDADGRRYRERVIAGKAYRYYADEGRRLGSVWTDIPAMIANTPLHPEATGYPTQKPLRLLERLVVAASPEGGLVADLMCGSGTTLVAAARHGRRFVGADRSPLAIETTEARLRREGIEVERIDLGLAGDRDASAAHGTP
jgi:site-specific DNA-methyltransferase (adenine-specific)